MAEEKQEGQKTVVSFIVGLLIGGLLVWAFSGPSADSPEDKKDADNKEEIEDKDEENDEKATNTVEVKTEENKDTDNETKPGSVRGSLQVGEGKVTVNSQPVSSRIKLDSVTYPVKEGWIGVRDYQDGKLGGILGVVRFSEEQGLVPTEIILQRSTVAGKEYAVVIYEENGDRKFNVAEDKQIDKIFTTFTATAK